MIIIKHVEYKIQDLNELENLVDHLKETTSRIEGITLKDIYFRKEKSEFILLLECLNENIYLKWRKICPPPKGGRDYYEVFMSKKEYVQII
jgi:hypothetical protein